MRRNVLVALKTMTSFFEMVQPGLYLPALRL